MNTKLVIPNLCRNSTLLVILILSLAVVTIAWLFMYEGVSLTDFGMALFYVVFAALLSVGILCLSRALIARLPLSIGVLLALSIMIGSVMVVELIYQAFYSVQPTDLLNYPQLLSRAVAAFLVAAILLRLFMLINVFDQRSKAEAESKVLALQSRIQPHFLFNSLNTISELAATDAHKAEQATTALATVFRASLENQRKAHSLAQEIKLCQRYLELERFRMQDKLRVHWRVDIEQTSAWEMPKLMLQPLIENALVHGVDEDGKVTVDLDFKETKSHLSLMVKNNIGNCLRNPAGHGIALDNIRQRLDGLYDDQYTFRAKQNENVYSVLLRIPKCRFVAEPK